jgi:hypothetical protein
MVTYAGDITVAGPSGIVAEVEVKNTTGLDLVLARTLMEGRRALLGRARPQYLMLASQDRAFLWRLVGSRTLADAPVWELPMAEYLRPYTTWLEEGARLFHDDLKLLVFNWLSELAGNDADRQRLPPTSPLVQSGLLDALPANDSSVAMVVA